MLTPERCLVFAHALGGDELPCNRDTLPCRRACQRPVQWSLLRGHSHGAQAVVGVQGASSEALVHRAAREPTRPHHLLTRLPIAPCSTRLPAAQLQFDGEAAMQSVVITGSELDKPSRPVGEAPCPPQRPARLHRLSRHQPSAPAGSAPCAPTACTAFIAVQGTVVTRNPRRGNERQRAAVKRVVDKSTYTVLFSDGDTRDLKRGAKLRGLAAAQAKGDRSPAPARRQAPADRKRRREAEKQATQCRPGVEKKVRLECPRRCAHVHPHARIAHGSVGVRPRWLQRGTRRHPSQRPGEGQPKRCKSQAGCLPVPLR